MTFGLKVYEQYTQSIFEEAYAEFYDAWDTSTHPEHIQSIIRCINERYHILRPHDPSPYEQSCLNAIQLGNRELSYKAFELSTYLTERFKTSALNHIFVLTLYFRHNTLCHYLNIPNVYDYKLDHYIRFFDILPEYKEQVYAHYGLYLLSRQRYKESFPYTITLNRVEVGNLNIHPFTQDGFKPYDMGKTLLVYMSGGIGDNIMYSRFIRRVCLSYPQNKVIFLVYDGLYWIYEYIYKDLNNIEVVSFCNRDKLSSFDYHANVCYLYALLRLDYKDIYIEYFPSLPTYPTTHHLDGYILIQWKGNPLNSHEEHNRQMKLEEWVPFLQRRDINCVSIAKDLTHDEKKILTQYHVLHLDLDGTDIYRHSIPILQSVRQVISTDTSLVHLCGTLNVPCIALLTAGCDWRWGSESTTKWYPHMKLLRQKKAFDWSHVIDELVVIPVHG